MADQRTIIVTGCSSGIGAYCARALKADGWRVFATVRKFDDLAPLEADGIEAFRMDYTQRRHDFGSGARRGRADRRADRRVVQQRRLRAARRRRGSLRPRRCALSSKPMSSAGTN